jgi:hypothetical protein
MKRFLGVILVMAASLIFAAPVFADECTETGAGVLVTPIAKNLTIDGGGARIDDTFTVQNQANKESVFKIYAAPYSEGEGKKDFEKETNFTQISRWIKFLDASGGLVDTLEIRVPACSKREVNFRVITPDSIPDGGQYAVIFTESSDEGSSVINSASRVGMLVYAHVNGGETIREISIDDLKIGKKVDSSDKTVIFAGAKLKNGGNIDLDVTTTLTIKNILGHEVYKNSSGVSLLPGSAVKEISDVWDSAPYLGLFVVDYEIMVGGEVKASSSQVVLLLPLPVLILVVPALIVVVVGVVLFIKKQRNKRRDWREFRKRI